jgi:hypothetical protein
MGSRLFPTLKLCYNREQHEKHKWPITRMGESAWFKCPGVPIKILSSNLSLESTNAHPMSFKLYPKILGGHVHVDILTSEFGPETTHGTNGTLVFRLGEWETFKQLILNAHGATVAIIHVDGDVEGK